ncbi:MAG: hypothetical protein E7351_04065 [Clostridiales bacterium]|nr:hypothetical protein [Clostridiales bacterium]
MKIVCVAGGSYKSFYINCCLRLRKCDLLIFNFDIIYDYVIKDEILGNGVVTKEILLLADRLKCTVLAGVNVIRGNKKSKAILSCDGEKICIHSISSGAKIFIKGKNFVVGDRTTNYGKLNKIILTDRRVYPNVSSCSRCKIYIFCDKFGVDYINNKKLIRNFNKHSKIILK